MGSHSNNKVQNEENEWKTGENIPKNCNFSKKLFTKSSNLLIHHLLNQGGVCSKKWRELGFVY